MTNPAAEPEIGPEAVFDRVRSSNPFTDNRVSGPAAPTSPDVEAVNRPVFQRLTDLAAEALSARRGLGAVLWGEAGIGKSHLLARLGRWASSSVDDSGPRAVLVALHNLQSAPDYLPRAVLRTAVATLTAGRPAASRRAPLFDLVRAAALRSVNGDVGNRTWRQFEAAFLHWMRRDALAGPVPGDTDIHRVLFRYFMSVNRAHTHKEDGAEARRAVRWLSGQPLDPEEARSLGLAPRAADEPVALADNQAVKEALVALCRLAAARERPFVLAFDQVDNLDDDQFAALARFLEALIDAAPNLLVVTSGIQNTLMHWKEMGVVQESAWHRLAQFEFQLRRLSPEQALSLVRHRLDHFFAGRPDLDGLGELRRGDPLFPLGLAWRRQFLEGRLDVRPRDAINSAREAWRAEQEVLREQDGPEWLRTWSERQRTGRTGESPPTADEVRDAVDRRVEEALADHRARSTAEPLSLPPDGDHLAGLLYNLLVQCREADPEGLTNVERGVPPRRGARPVYDVVFGQAGADGTAAQTGLVVVVASNAVSAAACLRRLLNETRPVERVLLITDDRVDLPLGPAGKGYLNELLRRRPERFGRLSVTFADLVELDGLQAVLAAARSGDLEVQLRPDAAHAVTPAEVIASHRRRGRYLASPLLRELLAPGPRAAEVGA